MKSNRKENIGMLVQFIVGGSLMASNATGIPYLVGMVIGVLLILSVAKSLDTRRKNKKKMGQVLNTILKHRPSDLNKYNSLMNKEG